MSYLASGAVITQAKQNNLGVLSKAINYTALGTDDIILCTAALTITLYSAALNQDGAAFQRALWVLNGSTGGVVVTCGGGDTFSDGSTTMSLSPGQSVSVFPDGVSKWYKSGGYVPPYQDPAWLCGLGTATGAM